MSTLRVGSEGYSKNGVNGRVGVGTSSPSERFEVSGGDSKLGGGAWNNGHLVLGNYHIWVDNNGKLRIKNGFPEGHSDGDLV